MSELAPNWNGKSGMPSGLRGTLVVVVLQILANGFVGWLTIASLDGQNSRDGAAVGYFLGGLSLVLAAVLLVCTVFTVWPQHWARPVLITIESIAIANGGVNLLNGGSVGALLAIVLGIATIAILRNDEIREWYRYGRIQR